MPSLIQLKSNCLITRRPIVLVPSLKSIFFHKPIWSCLPDYLFEHGYQCQKLALPFNNSTQRKHNFYQILKSKSILPSHFVFDSESFQELIFNNPFFQKSTDENIFFKHTLTVTTLNHNSIQNYNENCKNSFLLKNHFFNQNLFFFPTVESQITLSQIALYRYRVHQLWLKLFNQRTPQAKQIFLNATVQEYHLFIDHCVKLAELDFETQL